MSISSRVSSTILLWSTIACHSLFFNHFASAGAPLGTWPVVNVGKPSKLFVSGVAHGNGTWVAVGQGGYIASSQDGISWKKRSAGISRDFNGIVYSRGRFIAVSKAPDQGSGAKIWVSDDNGASWKYRDTDASGDSISVGLHAVATDGNGGLVAVGGFGWVTRSYDNGSTWHVLASKFTSTSLYGIGYGKGMWIATENGTGLYRSFDGTTWETISSTIGSTAVSYGNGRFVIADNYKNSLRWSSDGQHWKQCTASAEFGGGTYFSLPKGCAFYDGLFVAVTEYGKAWTSENGRDFKPWVVAGGDPDCWAVGGSERGFVAVGGDFKLNYGVGWTSPAWMKARLGSTWDFPYTVFDSDGGSPRKIGLPEYRVNTSSLNLLLEGTLFSMPTLGAPVSIHLVYASSPVADGSAGIGIFGKNWHCQYESVVGQFGPDARMVTPGGRTLLFTTPDGSDLSAATSPVTLSRPAGVFDDLIFTPGAGFQFKEKRTRVTYQYGVAGGEGNSLWRLTKIVDRNNNATNLSVNASSGRVNSITDPSLRTVSFSYNADNLCSQISLPDGRSLHFEYDSHKNLTAIQDMMGYRGSYEYDKNGFMVRMTTAGRSTSFTYVRRPGFEDPDSVQDGAGDLALASVLNPAGGLTKYEILPNKAGVKRTDPKGNTVVYSNDKGQTDSVVDPLGHLRSIAFSEAKLPEAFTDEEGHVTQFEYDARGNLTKTTDALGHVIAYTFDAGDNMLTRTNALGGVNTFTYDANHRVTTASTPLGNTTTFTYFANGCMKSLKDARNNTSSYTVNGNGDCTSIADPLSNTTSIAYDSVGRCTGITDPRGKTKSFQYDSNDRLLSTIYTSAPGTPSRTNQFNAFGQVAATDELGQTSSFERNEFGFPTKITDPLGGVTVMEYDPSNNQISVVDPLNRLSSTTYDSSNRPLVSTDPAGKTVTRVYDANGSLASLKDKRGKTSSFAYDANGRALSATDPLGKTVTNTRDALGRVTLVTNARGQSVQFTFDGDGHVTKKEYRQSPTGNFATEATFAYDANGNIVSQIDRWGTTTRTFDSLNRATSVTYPTSMTASFSYNASGLLETVTYPGGLVVTYFYDDFNRLPSPTGKRSGNLAGNQERAAQITALQMSLGGVTRTISYAYNAAGLPTLTTRPAPAPSTAYTYDSLNRLASMVYSSGSTVLLGWSYGLDAVSNPTLQTGTGSLLLDAPMPAATTMKFNDANQVISRNSDSYTYDADGNLTEISGNKFAATYTPDNMPSQIVRITGSSSETLLYTYDAKGMRVKRAVQGGATQQFHYGPDGALLFTTDGAGTVQEIYIWKGQTLAATLAGPSLATDLRYPLLDSIGSVAAVVKPDSTPQAQYSYDPYGGVSRVGISGPLPMTFVGGFGVQDEGGGLFYMGRRFYDSDTGRFLQKDPKGGSGGLNLYAYALANPARFVDPAGLEGAEPKDSYGWTAAKSAFNYVPGSNLAQGAYEILYKGEYKDGAKDLALGGIELAFWETKVVGAVVNTIGQGEILAKSQILDDMVNSLVPKIPPPQELLPEGHLDISGMQRKAREREASGDSYNSESTPTYSPAQQAAFYRNNPSELGGGDSEGGY